MSEELNYSNDNMKGIKQQEAEENSETRRMNNKNQILHIYVIN